MGGITLIGICHSFLRCNFTFSFLFFLANYFEVIRTIPALYFTV